MNKRTLTINGENFSDIETFYIEMDNVLTKDLDWKTGHNLNAFNDQLRGGFGIHDYEEPIKIIWTNFIHSKTALGEKLTEDIVEIIKGHDHVEFIAID